MNLVFEQQLLRAVESARKNTELRLAQTQYDVPDTEFRRQLTQEFSAINSAQKDHADFSPVFLDQVQIQKVPYEPEPHRHGYTRSVVGGAMVIAGQPLLKKRFVMAGSAAGTSIASKYLSKAFPQMMPKRVLGTRVFGRALGRAVPYVGWGLLAIDVIELLIESNEDAEPAAATEGPSRGFGGFGGGSFGGGGSSGRW